MSNENVMYTVDIMIGRPPVKDAPPFGQQLAFFRKRKGITQSELARAMGMTRKAIDYYERRATNPNLDFIQRAAKILDVPIAELLGEQPPSERHHPGPKSTLQRRLEEIQTLPRSKQNAILQVLDMALKAPS